MTEHMWGVTAEKLTRREETRRDRIARRIGGRTAGFASIREPNGARKGWFFGPNRGEPFNSKMAREIDAACGLVDANA